MTVNELLEYFDNWDMNIVINYFCEHQLNPIYKNNIQKFWDERNSLLSSEVDSFGFYDNELCVRIYGDDK